MNIFIYTNDFIYSLIILVVILYGTKLVNYYYNFYHIFTYLDYEQKLEYFKSNYLVNLISKYAIVKKIMVHYILIPVIKLNYLFMSIFITLLYSLCYVEFKKILREQYIKKHIHKKNKKKTYDMILTEPSNDIINSDKIITCLDNNSNNSNNHDNTNSSKDDINLSKDDANLLKDEIILQNDIEYEKYLINKKKTYFTNNVSQVDKICLDYDNGILNIIEFITVEEELQNSFNPNNIIDQQDILKFSNEIKNKSIENQQIENNKIEITQNSSTNNKLNLLNEIDLLKTNNDIENENILTDIINEDNISNYICDNINDNINDDINDNNDNNINEYLFIDNKIENISKLIDVNNLNIKKNTDNPLTSINDETNETINLEDIDFGSNLENIVNRKINNKTNKSETITVMEKKIIKIGKKKKN
jgi:hypothetical protein